MDIFSRKLECPKCDNDDEDKIKVVKPTLWEKNRAAWKLQKATTLYVCKKCGFTWENRA
jgi:DNA-directed RNA polymerase subunit M/transcription elongation factor TFIIS